MHRVSAYGCLGGFLWSLQSELPLTKVLLGFCRRQIGWFFATWLHLRRFNLQIGSYSKVFYCFLLLLTDGRQVLKCYFIFFTRLILFNILSMHLKLSSPNPVLKTPGSPTFQLIIQTETCISPYSCAVNYSDELSICQINSYFSISVKACQKNDLRCSNTS